MPESKPTNCHYCGYCCALIADVDKDKVVDVRPDTSRFPYSEQIMAGCPRWRLNVEDLDAANRVNYPLKRVGKRGGGQWERISWDDAIGEISQKLLELKQAYGPQTLASAIGGPHGSFWPLHRFMNAFGSPNNMGIGQICWNPRIWMDCITYGWTVEPDIQYGITECVMLWGTNPAQSDNSAFWRSIVRLRHTDTCVITIDPRYTQTAAHSDLWVPIKPGTDCIFALGLIHELVGTQLVDTDFINQWCYGYDELKAHVQPYDLAYVSTLCDIEPSLISEVARTLGASAAAAIISGRGVDQIGENVAPTHRAIAIIRAITGNLDKPGACLLNEAPDFLSEVEMERADVLDERNIAVCLNGAYTPLQSYVGYSAVTKLTERLGRVLPLRYMTSAHPDLVFTAVKTGKPYPVRALIVEATNPLLTYADTQRVYDCLMALDMLVVLDYRITPTAALADYVLPVAGAIERPIMQIHGGVANNAYGGPAAVKPYYERKTDYEIFRSLGLALGQTDIWPDDTLEKAYERQLSPAHITWSEFCIEGYYGTRPEAYKHVRLDSDGMFEGFATSTKKVELASELLTSLHGQRLPEPVENATHSSDEFILITGARKQPYNASMYRQFEQLRARAPYPVAEMSIQAASSLGLESGDVIKVSNDFGSALFKLRCVRMRDDVVSIDYGWWHAEETPVLPDLAGIWESNANMLTRCFVGESMIGTWSYNALPCHVDRYEGPWSFDQKNE